MFHHAMFCRRATQVLRLTASLNGIAFESGTRLLSGWPELRHCPDLLSDRLRASFTPNLPEGVGLLDVLISESLDLAGDLYDAADVARHRHRFLTERRPAWDGPPEIDF